MSDLFKEKINKEIDKKIDESTMENLEILSKLSLSESERESAISEMEKILSYVDKLGELDTSDVEPLIQVMPVENVFREDVVSNGDGIIDILVNAPLVKENMFVVPKTV